MPIFIKYNIPDIFYTLLIWNRLYIKEHKIKYSSHRKISIWQIDII